jgi:hypothetical protein
MKMIVTWAQGQVVWAVNTNQYDPRQILIQRPNITNVDDAIRLAREVGAIDETGFVPLPQGA